MRSGRFVKKGMNPATRYTIRYDKEYAKNKKRIILNKTLEFTRKLMIVFLISVIGAFAPSKNSNDEPLWCDGRRNRGGIPGRREAGFH